MEIKDCKYRLPCNWCDKYNRRCEAIESAFEIEKLKQECMHEDFECKLEKTPYYNGKGYTYYIEKKKCRKCGTINERMFTMEEEAFKT